MQIQSVKNYYSSLFRSTNDKKITRQRLFQSVPILQGYPQNDTVEISFGGKYCATDNFKIKRLENLKCPVCGKLMLSDRQINSFIKDVAPKKGEELIQALEKYEDDYVFTNRRLPQKTSIYRPVAQEAVDILKGLAEKNPDEDLYGLYQIQKEKSIKELIPMQLEIMKKYKEYAFSHAIDEEHKEKLEGIIREYTEQIYGIGDTQFSRKAFISAAIGAFSDTTEEDEVYQIVQAMPNSKSKVEAFFIKYGNKISNSEDAARSLVVQTAPTTDHIQPKSKGGANMLSNYIADCGHCNNRRGNLDFCAWIQTIPDFQKNMQEYLYEVQDAIDEGVLDHEYQKYIPDVISTVESLSNGQIELKLTESKAPKIVAETTAEKRKKTEELKQIIANMITKKDALHAEISEIEGTEEYSLYIQHEALSHKIDELISEKDKLEDEIRKLRRKKSKTSHIVIPFFRTMSNKSRSKDVFMEHSIEMRIKKHREELRKFCDDIKELKTEKKALVYKIPPISDIEARINNLSEKQSEKSKITGEIQKCKRVIGTKNDVIQRNIQASDESSKLEKQNNLILARGFDVSDTADYDEYKRAIELLAQGESIKKERKCTEKSKVMYEIFDIGIASLREKIGILSKKESVIYFENVKRIQRLYAEMDECSKELDNIYEAEKQHNILYKKLLKISKEIGNIDADSEIERLSQKKSLLEKIKQLKSMKAEYEKLSDAIAHNQQIYAQMQNFNMLNAVEFSRLFHKIIR